MITTVDTSICYNHWFYIWTFIIEIANIDTLLHLFKFFKIESQQIF
jgi:hypothetical protein